MVGPFAILRRRVGVAEYAPVFQAVLSELVHVVDVYRRRGIDIETIEYSDTPRMIDAIWSHVLALQNAHNRLVDIRPESRYFALHKAIVKTCKAYCAALADQADMLTQDLPDGDARRYEHHRFHGAQWDDMAGRWGRDLAKKLEDLRHRDKEAFEQLVGAEDLPAHMVVLLSRDLRREMLPRLGTFCIWH
jgi:hypothetical protein